MKKIILIIFLVLIILFVGGGFWYLNKFIIDNMKGKNIDDQLRVIYQVNNFDNHGGPIKTEYHSINLNGKDDKIIYSTTNRANAAVLNHKDIAISETMSSIADKILDKNGKSIADKYENIKIDTMSFSSINYSANGNIVATLQWSSEKDREINVLYFKNKNLQKYQCSVCVEHLDYNFYTILGFSNDNKKLYFSINRDEPLHRMDNEPNTKYFYLDLESGNIYPFDIEYKDGNGEYYDFYFQHNVSLRIKNATYFKPGSIYLVNLNDLSEKMLANDLSDQVKPIFNGKDVVYGKFFERSAYLNEIIIKGVNIFSGEQYDVLPVKLVNTPKTGKKELLDFIPDSSKFIYKIEHDSGWELRTHNIDTGEDESIINLTSGRSADKNFYYKSYLGIIF